MKRRISVSTYRAIDLAMLAGVLVLLENLIVRASRFWYADQLYTVSLVAPVTGLVMMRWGAWGLVHAFLGGVVFVLASGGSAEQLIIYCVGNLLAATGLWMRRRLGSGRITGSGLFTLAYAILVQVSMQAGRAVVAILLGRAARNCIAFFTTDSLSILFSMLVLWIARRQDGVLEDQETYLRRLHEGENRAREELHDIDA